MPRTSSLGDIHRTDAQHPREDHMVTVSVIDGGGRGMETWYRYERLVSGLACVVLVMCGIGVGIWASI